VKIGTLIRLCLPRPLISLPTIKARGNSDSEDASRAHLPTTARSAFLIRRPQPGGGGAALVLAHAGVDFTRPGIEGVQAHYLREEGDGRITALPQLAWADWDREGRLLAATIDGSVCV
jgi:hypothetical protein